MPAGGTCGHWGEECGALGDVMKQQDPAQLRWPLTWGRDKIVQITPVEMMQSLKKACPCGRNTLRAGTSSDNTSQPLSG